MKYDKASAYKFLLVSNWPIKLNPMVKVLIKKLSTSVKTPIYKTLGASGMDLMAFIKSPVTIKPKTSFLIPTGLSLAFSKDYEIQMKSGLYCLK